MQGDRTDAGYVERARALAPLLEASADQVETDRCLTPLLLDGLHDAKLFRLLLPRFLDGGEVDPVTFVRMIEEIAKGEASAAWCLCQAGGCAMTAAYLLPEVAREVFGDRRAVLAWGPGPDARAIAVDGGYRVTGTWSFASGCRHATWLGGHCPILTPDGAPRRRPDGRREERTMLFPAASAEIVRRLARERPPRHGVGRLHRHAIFTFPTTTPSRAMIRPSAASRGRSTASPRAAFTPRVSPAWPWGWPGRCSTRSWTSRARRRPGAGAARCATTTWSSRRWPRRRRGSAQPACSSWARSRRSGARWGARARSPWTSA